MDKVRLLSIIEGCCNGQAAAEEALYRHFAPRVIAIARRYAADEPQALDYLQECFVVLFDKIKQYDPNKGTFEAWMHRLCVNVILQWIRANKSKQQTVALPDDLIDDVNAADTDWQPPDEEQVIAALQALPAGYREVFNLYAFEQWSHRDIAKHLGISVSSSRSQLSRARQWLQKKLQPSTKNHGQTVVR